MKKLVLFVAVVALIALGSLANDVQAQQLFVRGGDGLFYAVPGPVAGQQLYVQVGWDGARGCPIFQSVGGGYGCSGYGYGGGYPVAPGYGYGGGFNFAPTITWGNGNTNVNAPTRVDARRDTRIRDSFNRVSSSATAITQQKFGGSRDGNRGGHRR